MLMNLISAISSCYQLVSWKVLQWLMFFDLNGFYKTQISISFALRTFNNIQLNTTRIFNKYQYTHFSLIIYKHSYLYTPSHAKAKISHSLRLSPLHDGGSI